MSILLSPKRRSRVRAFTLIEVAIALFVIAIGMLPIISLTLAARRLDSQAQIQSVAYQVAWQQMETLRSQAMADRLTTTNTAFTIPDFALQAYSTQTLTGRYSVTSVPGGDASHPIQRIAVQVSWGNAAAPGSGSSVRISTDVTKGAGV